LPEGKPIDFKGWMKWDRSSKQTESGEVAFQYTQLSQLRKEIPPPSPNDAAFETMSKIFSTERIYDTDIITLFHASGDFRYRTRWMEGVRSVETLNHFLPRVGMQCRCGTDKGPITIISSYYHYQDDKIQFTEQNEKQSSFTHFVLEKVGVKKTRLTLSYYLKKNWLSVALFKLTETKKLEDSFKKSMQNLEQLVKELRIPSALDA